MNVENIYPNWHFCPQDIGLYNCLSGNTIFFASLFKITKNAKYKNILDMTLNTIDVDCNKKQPQSLSAFSGWASLAYMYGFLGKQFKEMKYLNNAKQNILKCKKLVKDTDNYDIVEGIVGCWLCEENHNILAGMAHGNAGISLPSVLVLDL